MKTNSSSSLTKFANLFFFLIVFLILFSSCENNFKKIIGKTYIYEDSIVTLTVGFDKDTMYYIMKDARRPFFFKSKYDLKKLNDTNFRIEVPTKPGFWETNIWDITVKDSDGFYSTESKRYYRTYADSMLIKKGF